MLGLGVTVKNDPFANSLDLDHDTDEIMLGLIWIRIVTTRMIFLKEGILKR